MGLEIFTLEGKTALITGASRGIGAAIALAYAECGADVTLAARSTADLEALAGKIEGTGRRAIPITCDVTDAGQVGACVERVIGDLGRIDVLVNNAGGTKFLAPFLGTREEGWMKGINLNLHGVYHFCRAVGAHMVERQSGSIVNVASVGGLRASPTMSPYGAAKAAVIQLTKTLAVEWAHANVRVNVICPGWVRTELNRNLWEDPAASAATISRTPLQRWGETGDIVGAAVWLASDASAYATGSTLVIDGGANA